MLKLALDTRSRYHVIVPEAEQQTELIRLGSAFITYDQTLPPSQQSPLAPRIAALLKECVPHQQQFYHNEAERSIASDNAKRFEAEAYDYLKLIQQHLKVLFWRSPAEAGAWGFAVKQSTGNILFPKSRRKQLQLLKRYIAQEQSRPPAERFTTPDLTTLIELRDNIVANREIAHFSRADRKHSRIARDSALQRLKELLRVAAAVIVVTHFEHTISFELQHWGFEVRERRPKGEPQAEVTAPTPNGAAAVSPPVE